jgi:hypothetical protein
MKTFKNTRFTVVLMTLALGASAQAAPITGGINIGALSTVSINKTLNTVKFSPGALPGVNALVSYSSGNLALLAPALTFGSYKNFSYSPLVVVNPIWKFNLVSFDLTQVTSISESGSGLVLAGTGFLKAAGYDDTLGKWSFSADSSGGLFSWSSTAMATSVPDGGTSMGLLGLSLLGLAGISRKLRKI